ncbi:MAG: carbohydrate ABC transporter permease [Candidatus Omnitrophica bacterium]|nr:carbohydrate ABC transporter permease [Candidatus Omnitrophota bacterium]
MNTVKFKELWIVGILTLLLILTLAPLVLMFYWSVKPGGTLTKPVREIVLTPSDSIPLRLDMRKFTHLEFFVKGEKGGESFRVVLKDILGNEVAVPIQEMLKGGVSQDWQKVSLPIDRFDLSQLNPAILEKVAEELMFVLDKEGAEKIFIKEVRLAFKRFTLVNYVDVLVGGFFGRYFINSLLITLVVVLGNLLFSSMVGYAFARKEFPGKEFLFLLILGNIMIPSQVLMIPIFILMKNLHWLNTYWALTIPALVAPFNIFFMRQYISALPSSLEDAARIDGAGDFQIFFRIVLPLSKPALAVVGINTFMGSWNTFLYPFLLTNTPEMRTLPVGLALYKSLMGVDWVRLMAASSITALPVILTFLFFQRYIIAGLTAGTVTKK